VAKTAWVEIADRAMGHGTRIEMNQDFGRPTEVVREDLFQFSDLSVGSFKRQFSLKHQMKIRMYPTA
jgi:hypothetical protein